MSLRSLTQALVAGTMLTGSAIAGQKEESRKALVNNADGRLREQTFTNRDMTYPSKVDEKLNGYSTLINAVYTGKINQGDAVDFVRYDNNGKAIRKVRAIFVGIGEQGKGHYEVYGDTGDMPAGQPLFLFQGNEHLHLTTAEGLDKMGLDADQIIKN